MSQKNLSANHCAQANDTRSFCPSLLSDTATISVHSETDGTPSPFSRGQVLLPVFPLPHSASTTQTMPSDSTPAPPLPCMPTCFPNPLPAPHRIYPVLQLLYHVLLIASPIRQLHYILCRSIPQCRYIKKISNVIKQHPLSPFHAQVLFQHDYTIPLFAFPRLIFKFRNSFTLQPYILIPLLFDYFLFYVFRFLPLLCFYRVFRFTLQYLPCLLRQFFRTFYQHSMGIHPKYKVHSF